MVKFSETELKEIQIAIKERISQLRVERTLLSSFPSADKEIFEAKIDALNSSLGKLEL